MKIANDAVVASTSAAGVDIYEFIVRLYPLRRSITGEGVRQSVSLPQLDPPWRKPSVVYEVVITTVVANGNESRPVAVSNTLAFMCSFCPTISVPSRVSIWDSLS